MNHAGILHKPQTLESTYEKISDQATNRRTEILEWVVVVLIVASIGREAYPQGSVNYMPRRRKG